MTQMHELQQPKRIRTGFLSGPKGELGFLEYIKTGSHAEHHPLPFSPKRIYWVNASAESSIRGDHAHVNSSRVFVALSGSIEVEITFKDSRIKSFNLHDWSEGLWVPPGFWYRCKLSADALLLVISSHTHEEDIYVRDKEDYLSGYRRHGEWIFSHNYLPQVYKRSYPLLHYGMRRYQFIASGKVSEVFYIAKGAEILGRWPFQIQKHMAVSLSGAPFGGLQVLDAVPVEVVQRWVAWVLGVLKGMKIKQVRNRVKPDFLLSTYEEKLNQSLVALGFEEIFSDHNQYIDVRGDSTPKLHQMQERKLHKLLQYGAKVVEESAANLEEIYYYIAQARTNRGIPLNVRFKQMKSLFQSYPNKYSIYSVFDKKNVRMATCIMVKPGNDTWYYFLPATGVDHMNKSPMVLLIHFLAAKCKAQGLSYLDLGLSSIEGHLQSGLHQFKERMGAQDSAKRTLQINL